jgi:hypothetical protein
MMRHMSQIISTLRLVVGSVDFALAGIEPPPTHDEIPHSVYHAAISLFEEERRGR